MNTITTKTSAPRSNHKTKKLLTASFYIHGLSYHLIDRGLKRCVIVSDELFYFFHLRIRKAFLLLKLCIHRGDQTLTCTLNPQHFQILVTDLQKIKDTVSDTVLPVIWQSAAACLGQQFIADEICCMIRHFSSFDIDWRIDQISLEFITAVFIQALFWEGYCSHPCN